MHLAHFGAGQESLRTLLLQFDSLWLNFVFGWARFGHLLRLGLALGYSGFVDSDKTAPYVVLPLGQVSFRLRIEEAHDLLTISVGHSCCPLGRPFLNYLVDLTRGASSDLPSWLLPRALISLSCICFVVGAF